ncbi:MAG: hypothetical protein ACT4P6_17565 [Gemmatimonadaceae bacterium]
MRCPQRNERAAARADSGMLPGMAMGDTSMMQQMEAHMRMMQSCDAEPT